MMVPTSPVIAVATVVKSVLLLVTMGISNMTINATITTIARMNLRSASLVVIDRVTVSIDSSAGLAAIFSPLTPYSYLDFLGIIKLRNHNFVALWTINLYSFLRYR